MALALLLLAACGQATPQSVASPTPTPAPTYTPAPAGPLAWRARRPATGDAPQVSGNPAISFSQADGGLAYECAVAGIHGTAPAAVWVTRDGAATWRRGADLPAGDGLQSCAIQPDDDDPSIAVAGTVPYAFTYSNPNGRFLTYATFDAGASWAPITGPYDTVRQVATYRGVTFALFARHVESHSRLASTLARSADRMRTWAPIVPPGAAVSDFWLNPATGELLALTSGGTANSFGLAVSRDAGDHWAPLPAPAATDGYVVRPPIANQPWQLCALHTQLPVYTVPTPPTPPPHLLTCSTDGGRTWADRSGPELYAVVVGIANDGSVLKGSFLKAGPWRAQGTCGLLRLAPAATQWESLGQSPTCGQMTYVGGSGHGVLWLVPDPYDTTPGATPTPPQRLLYTADYP